MIIFNDFKNYNQKSLNRFKILIGGLHNVSTQIILCITKMTKKSHYKMLQNHEKTAIQ